MTVAVDLLIVAGQPLPLPAGEFIWEIDGVPVDLTTFTARASIRKSLNEDGDPLATWTSANGKIVLGTTDGKITLTVSATETAAMWANDLELSGHAYKGRRTYTLGYWDLEIVSALGVPERLMQGIVTICPEATR